MTSTTGGGEHKPPRGILIKIKNNTVRAVIDDKYVQDWKAMGNNGEHFVFQYTRDYTNCDELNEECFDESISFFYIHLEDHNGNSVSEEQNITINPDQNFISGTFTQLDLTKEKLQNNCKFKFKIVGVAYSECSGVDTNSNPQSTWYETDLSQIVIFKEVQSFDKADFRIDYEVDIQYIDTCKRKVTITITNIDVKVYYHVRLYSLIGGGLVSMVGGGGIAIERNTAYLQGAVDTFGGLFFQLTDSPDSSPDGFSIVQDNFISGNVKTCNMSAGFANYLDLYGNKTKIKRNVITLAHIGTGDPSIIRNSFSNYLSFQPASWKIECNFVDKDLAGTNDNCIPKYTNWQQNGGFPLCQCESTDDMQKASTFGCLKEKEWEITDGDYPRLWAKCYIPDGLFVFRRKVVIAKKKQL